MSSIAVNSGDRFREGNLYVFAVELNTSTKNLRVGDKILTFNKDWEIVGIQTGERTLLFKCIPYFNDNVKCIDTYLTSKNYVLGEWFELPRGHSATYTHLGKTGRVEVVGEFYSILETVESRDIRELDEKKDEDA